MGLNDYGEGAEEEDEGRGVSKWTPHWFGAVDGPVEAITMFGAHGERLQLHN